MRSDFLGLENGTHGMGNAGFLPPPTHLTFAPRQRLIIGLGNSILNPVGLT